MIFADPQGAWDWFLTHQEKFKYPSRLTKHECRHWHQELHEEIRLRTLKFLFIEITVDEPNHQARMLISAHGNPKLFEMVELMILSAPVIEGWEFVGFYPPVPSATCMRHNYPSVTTRPEEMFFSPPELVQEDGRYNVKLYVTAGEQVGAALNGAATQMMFNLLGEKTGGLYVRKVTVVPLQAASPQAQQSLTPFTELPGYIQLDGRSGLMVSPNGRIK